MKKEELVDYVTTALRCGGHEEVADGRPGFQIITENSSLLTEVEDLLSRTGGIAIVSLGIFDDGNELDPGTIKARGYRNALSEMGLGSDIVFLKGKRWSGSRTCVYVPIDQTPKTTAGLVGCQVHLRVTMYGQPVEDTLRHDIAVSLTIESDPDTKGWMVKGAAPQHCNGSQQVFVGRGRTMLGGVASWLRSVDQSSEYVSAHQLSKDKRFAEEVERRKMEQRMTDAFG